MSADNTTAPDLWEQHLPSIFTTFRQTEEIHVKLLRACMVSIYNLCSLQTEEIHVEVLPFAQVDAPKTAPYFFQDIRRLNFGTKTWPLFNMIGTHHPISRSFLLHQLHCSFIGQKQREMEMEEGSARVSWYERQLLIGPNHIFHRLLVEGRESFERGIGCVILYTFRRKLVDNLLCFCKHLIVLIIWQFFRFLTILTTETILTIEETVLETCGSWDNDYYSDKDTASYQEVFF